jgi:transposase
MVTVQVSESLGPFEGGVPNVAVLLRDMRTCWGVTGRRPRTLREALRVIDQLLQLNAQLQARIAALEAKVGALEEQLRQTSQNSSRPSSTDPPAVERLPKRPASGRRPGAQPGHDAQYRPLLPVEQVDVVVPVRPSQCQECGAPMRGTDPTPRRHQVTETPPVRPVVTEYQLHTLACRRCGHRTPAPWPAGVPRGGFGPRLTATVAVCTGVYHLSKRTTAGLLADLFGVDLAIGTVSACEQTVSAAVAAPVAAAQAYVSSRQSSTSTRPAGAKAGSGRGCGWR